MVRFPVAYQQGGGVLTVGSLFSGIGGFDLGLERAGMRTVWFCEQDAYCQRVLARHWPGVPVHDDVCALVADTECRGLMDTGDDQREHPAPRGRDAQDAQRLSSERDSGRALSVPVPPVDVLCGGFPCQDLSYAGAGAGLAGARSGLWSEYARLIGELRPRYVVVENVAALLARGLGTVLGDLAALGYDAEWDCIPASAFGAPHRRDRVWLVAYPGGEQHEGQGDAQRWPATSGLPQADTDPDCGRLEVGTEPDGEPQRPRLAASQRGDADGLRDDVADTQREGLQGLTGSRSTREGRPPGVSAGISQGLGGQWLAEPDVGRVAHGVPARVDRLRSLGNALVPQIAEWLGRRILDYEESCVTA